MRNPDFFEILQTTSSEVSTINLFRSWASAYIPDLFVTLFSVTLLGFAVCLDLFLTVFFILNYEWFIALIFAITLLPHSICEFIFDRKKIYECLSNYITSRLLHFAVFMLGFGSIITTSRILMETFTFAKMRSQSLLCFPYPFFHISSENFSTLKIYCCIHLVLKSIPQLFIVSVFLLGRYVTGVLGIILGVNIMMNILIFCQTMATTFPIRKTPRVFTNSTCILFNALNKFMATMCACCIHLTVFAVVFKRHKYYALLVTLLKTVLWVVPCWRMLRAQTIPITKPCFAVYFICISFVFGFIYVHPFEGLGKLYYYLFYLLGFMYELLVIYLFADANLESISYYLTLKILMFGFLSCFGLLNILHKYREKAVLHEREKSQEILNTEYKDVEINEEKENDENNKDKETSGTSGNKGATESGGNVKKPENTVGNTKGNTARKNVKSNTKNIPQNNPRNSKPKRNAEETESVEDYDQEKKVSEDEQKSRRFIWRWQ